MPRGHYKRKPKAEVPSPPQVPGMSQIPLTPSAEQWSWAQRLQLRPIRTITEVWYSDGSYTKEERTVRN